MKNKLKQQRFSSLTLLNDSEKKYPDSPDKAKLEVFENAFPERDYEIIFDCPEFTSLCPVTGQPDFGHITLHYIADKYCVESKSLKLHLFSYRNHNAFHEEVVNLILNAVIDAVAPRWAEVSGEFRPRGGIAIKVKASHGEKK